MKQIKNKSFDERVWTLCKKIPKGNVSTYKEIANALGTKAYRAVGNALNKNPYAPAVPCHRVVNSDGRVGGFAHGTKRKTLLLKKEGAHIKAGKVVELEKKMFRLSKVNTQHRDG